MNRDEALMQFERVMKLRNLSQNTVKMYLYYLSEFFEYIGKDDITQCDLSNAQTFVIHMIEDRGYQPLSTNVVIGAIRYFFDSVLNVVFSHRQFPNLLYPQFNPFLFTREQILALLETNDVRLRLIILLGIDCGMRVSEVASLRICDIDSKNMLIHIHESKRRKSRSVKLSDACLLALRKYWLLYRPKQYLFPGKDSRSHVITNTVRNWFNCHVRKFDFYTGEIHFHSLRHTFATNMLDNGCDIFLLQKLMGHASLASTARYVHLSTRAVELSFSLSEIWGIRE